MPGRSEERGGSADGRGRDDGSRTERLIRSAGPLTAVGGLVLVLAAVLALREVASLIVCHTTSWFWLVAAGARKNCQPVQLACIAIATNTLPVWLIPTS